MRVIKLLSSFAVQFDLCEGEISSCCFSQDISCAYYHMVGFGREPSSNGEDPDTLGHICEGRGCTIEIGGKTMEFVTDLALYAGKLAQPDLTYQIYEKHFIGDQKYRNKDGDKPANSERTLQMAK